MRNFDPRWLIVFLANLLLCWLAGVANHYLASLSVHVYLGGLFVTYAALRLDRTNGLIAIGLTALLLDAATPVPFGMSLLLLGLVHATLLFGRQQFPRESPVFGLVVALVSNLFLFIALSFLLVGTGPRPGQAWMRLFVDLLVSQFAIVVIASWFLALQESVMEFVQIHPETGRRVAP